MAHLAARPRLGLAVEMQLGARFGGQRRPFARIGADQVARDQTVAIERTEGLAQYLLQRELEMVGIRRVEADRMGHAAAVTRAAIARRRAPAEAAHEQYKMSDLFYARTPGTDLHRAYVATQLGAYSVSKGQGAEALRLIAPHIDTARRRENAALLSTLLLLRAEALELENRAAEAQAVRVDSLGWARYGFGSDWAVRAKMREIASLNPLK